MNRHPLLIAGAAAVAVAALALTGCSSHPSAQAAPQKASASLTPFPGATAKKAAPAADNPPERKKTPLQAFFDEIWGQGGSSEQYIERQKEQFIQIEDKISSCMKDQGFDYTPETYVAPANDPRETVDGTTDDDIYDRAFVTKYGYGAVVAPKKALGQQQGTGGNSDTADKQKAAGQSNNTAYINGLSAAQKQAYDLAYSGKPPADNDPTWNLSKAGCAGKAKWEVKGPDFMNEAQFKPFFQADATFESAWQSRPGMAQLNADWSACMTSKGQPGFKLVDDAAQSIYNQDGALWNATNGAAPQRSALESLFTKEKALALIDLDCREQTHYRDRLDTITTTAENQFMSDHKDEIAAMRAQLAQATGK